MIDAFRRFALTLVIALVAASCGGGSTPAATGHEHDQAHGAETPSAASGDEHNQAHGETPQVGSEMHGTVPGEPAKAREADRTIKVIANDKLQFSPSRIEVEAGEVVTFVVTNRGETEHEFVLGDRDYQEAHEMEMADEDMAIEHEGNAVTLPPGASHRLTWRFADSGEVLYGCHEPGHYQGGMVGTVYVKG